MRFRTIRLSLLGLNVALSLGASLALLSVFLALPAFAQAVAPAAPAPWWSGMVTNLTPWLLGAVVSIVLGRHLMHMLGDWLIADGTRRGGFFGRVERVAGVEANDVDGLLSKPEVTQAVKDLIDPAKRPGALQTLEAAGKAAAPQAAADAAKEAVQNG